MTNFFIFFSFEVIVPLKEDKMTTRHKGLPKVSNRDRKEVGNTIAVLVMAIIALAFVIMVMLWIPVP